MNACHDQAIQLSKRDGDMLATGSAVAVNGQALLFIGRSGSGKSDLSLQLMAYGATLVGDDRVVVRAEGGLVVLSPPPVISGKIEARGVGILLAKTTSAHLKAVVDLDRVEQGRLPPKRSIGIAGQNVPLLHKVESNHFAAVLWQYLMIEDSQ